MMSVESKITPVLVAASPIKRLTKFTDTGSGFFAFKCRRSSSALALKLKPEKRLTRIQMMRMWKERKF
jgi:hypothetical protein